MKTSLLIAACMAMALELVAKATVTKVPNPPARSSEEKLPAGDQPLLLHLSATVDGSGRFIFTSKAVRYEHRHWDPPVNVVLEGRPWQNLGVSPAGWSEHGARLDFSKARIVERKGRDTVALEQMADGFALYVNDSPDGAGDYEVIIAIPRRP